MTIKKKIKNLINKIKLSLSVGAKGYEVEVYPGSVDVEVEESEFEGKSAKLNIKIEK